MPEFVPLLQRAPNFNYGVLGTKCYMLITYNSILFLLLFCVCKPNFLVAFPPSH